MARTLGLLIVYVILRAASASSLAVAPTVVLEEVVTSYQAADNGAGPLWCYGSPLVVRQGNEVSVSIIETGKDVPPLCNTRWQLWRRDSSGWRIASQEADYRQREPCPLVGLKPGELLLSANPSTEPTGTQYGACEPVLIRFADADGGLTTTQEKPVWSGDPHFTDHSYRGLAADAWRGEVILLNIHARTSAEFISHRDSRGIWHARGEIEFPIRAAYPQAALRDGAAHVLAIGDIQEPVPEWCELKAAHLKRQWDYVFRRLFYTYSPDLEGEPFIAPLEIDTVDDTAGHITNLDLHVDANGTAHLLYLKQKHVHAFLRDKYFPGESLSKELAYVVIRSGSVEMRRTLCKPTAEGGFEPSYARFHVGPQERIYVVAAGPNATEAGTSFENRLFPVDDAADFSKLPLEHPFRTFFTSSPRGGSHPSSELDLFGTAEDSPNLRYSHVRLLDN
jgi:hypothetical protein